MDVQQQVRTTVEPLLAPLGIELVGVEIAPSGRGRVLRLFVDRDGGIDLDAIVEVNRAVTPALDAAPPVRGPYTLEVSSPGIERGNV